ncbi:hypothetical protein QBC40DRAFT_62466 [Triangularia verruculosa]|uniref:Mucin n=1 Tax=Triangularia verruculosa TaxID=2587418 RepID=A0AAN7AWA0_9PEZI|nr:hypothetical protein QBC40DRAFT_62466 [Triangularia verruculosa]
MVAPAITPEQEGATILKGTSMAAVSGLMALALEPPGQGVVDDMPWIIREARAAHPSPAFLEEQPSTPQTRLSFDLSVFDSSFSLQLPFFNNSSNASCKDRQPRHALAADDPRPTTTTNAKPHFLTYTFFLSPSASTSSIVSSLWSCGDHSTDSGETSQTHTTMPGPIVETDSHRFLPPIASDYHPGVTSSPAVPPRPHIRSRSATGKHERSASPLFSRWTRRHQRPQSQSNGQSSKLSGLGRASMDGYFKNGQRRPGHSRSNSIQKRQPQAAVPQMTREEFEALPVAIQRKYFSTLERLRFAQESGLVDGISQHYDDIAKGFRRRKARQDRNVSEQIVGHIRRGSEIESHFSNSDSSQPYTTRSDNTQEAELSREKQVLLARRLRASVILDAADEAVYKLNCEASRRDLTTGGDSLPSPPSPVRHSMDSHRGLGGPVDHADDTRVPQSFLDSFRWLDEEEDLDLRLFLDEYHAGLREGMPAAKQRPSFRRHLSISKIPFGRTSVSSSSRPATKDANTSPTSPYYPPASGASSPVSHSRRKSRTLSLITPKHVPQQSITAFDPAAAHYQDPEARLKLRVYLASPQKFDEAVEFGFPAADVLSGGVTPENEDDVATRRQSQQRLADDPSNMQSFLADEDEDENISLDSDPDSLADPESPKTPESFENRPGGLRPARCATPDATHHARVRTPEAGNYAQAPASSREMTLRMTLTRPDLRAHEDEIYGWQQRQQQQQQQQPYQKHTRRPTGGAVQAAEASRMVGSREVVTPKESMDWGKFDGVDHWNPNGTEKGVMKRIWNRMRRN